MRRTTIREVAVRAGVSHQTVSRVINKSPFVAAATRTQVLRAIAELDYHPNAHAVGLSRDRSDLVGLIVESVTSPFFAQIIAGVEQGLHDHGRHLLLGSTHGAPQIEAITELLHSRRIDGLIVVLPTSASIEQTQQLIRSGVPTVLLDVHDDVQANTIGVDNHSGAYSATEYLIRLGHRRIGLITGRSDVLVSQIRMNGYRCALRQHSIAFDAELVVPGDFSNTAGQRAVAQLLELAVPPTAIFACSDEMALGALGALHQRGINVPEDISVIGYDDIPQASTYHPTLTTIRQPLTEMGQLASHTICRIIDEPGQPAVRAVMGTRLIERGSTTWAHRREGVAG
jgi:DNA-binding LacI/PurR family transcriptional regulator